MKSERNWGRLDMKSNWTTTTIDDVCSLVTDGAHNSPKSVEKGYYMASVKDFTEYGFDFSSCRQISEEDYEKLRKHGCVPEKDDVLVGKDGARYFEDIIIYRQDEQPALLSSIAILRANPKKITPEFLYYTLKIPAIKKDVRDNYGSGSAIPRVVLKDFKRMPFSYPDIDEQRKITAVCSVIDAKIQVNNAINKNLDQQADAIYQSFFSPKSDIQGKRVTLDEYCSIFTGKKNANASVDGGKYKFFTCAPDALQIDSYIYDGNAIIVSGNGAYTGRTRFYSGRFDLYQRTYACTLLDGINPDYIFPLYWFVKLELSKKIMGGTRGSAIPYIVMNDLAKFEFIYSDEIFDTYVPVFKSLTESMHTNELENEHLSNLRNTLLPQLMSGELDVSDINL